MPVGEGKIRFGICLPKEVHRQLRMLAASKDGQTMSRIIEDLLRTELDRAWKAGELRHKG